MDAEVERLRGSDAGRDIRPGDDRAASQNRNPSPQDPPKVPGSSILGKIGKWLLRVFGSQIANAIQTVINLSALEDALDAYWRAVADYSATLDEAGKQQLRQQLRADSVAGIRRNG